jgi:serine/threonine protein kinase
MKKGKQFKLGDFGLSKQATQFATLNSTVGTPLYMSV